MQIRQLALALLPAVAHAQTYTSCQPLNETCDPDTGLDQYTYSVDFTQGKNSDWNITAGSLTYDSSLGAAFTINKKGDAPTIQSKFNIFFGVVSVFMRAANGTGIVSSAILESDDLDEIDFEWLGGENSQVQTNYFGKGNTTSYDRGKTLSMTDAQGTTHNYTIEWTSAATKWYVDGVLQRTLNYADALDGKNYPQTPMSVRLGIWAGGDSDNSEGTIEWAGGETDYSDSPYTMYVQKVDITNYNPASSYTYGDMTGDYTSIKASNTTTSNTTSSSSSGNSSTSSTSGSTSSSTSTGTSSSTSNSAVDLNNSAMPVGVSSLNIFMLTVAAICVALL